MALPKINNPRLEDELSMFSGFLTDNLKEYIVNKYQKNMVRVLLEFYDYDLKGFLRDILDVDIKEFNPEDSERRKHIFRSMYNGILDTFDNNIFDLIVLIGVVYNEERGNK